MIIATYESAMGDTLKVMEKGQVTPMLVVNSDGHIIAMNDVARLRVGECVGHLCWDAVGALDERRTPVCQPGCVGTLAESVGQQCSRVAMVRGAEHILTCTRLGDLTVVQFQDAFPVATDGQPARLPGGAVLLSARQSEVLHLVAQGNSAPAIAEQLGISSSTVRTHLKQLRKKLGAVNQAEAVAVALRMGAIG